MNFDSDNAVGASAKVLEAVVAANAGAVPSYGADPATREAERRLADLFERDVAAFLVGTGTAADALALAALAPAGTGVFCHEEAHIIEDECAAPEFFTGGAQLVGIPGVGGKITPAALTATLDRFPRGFVHRVQPRALSLSQATECGTVYSPDEVAALSGVAHQSGLAVHIDGARFANALAGLGVSAADLTWRAGVDALSFGATKNGAFALEAVIFFDPARAEGFGYRRKRGGHLWSKGRFLGAQMNAYLDGDHWLDLARHANACARRLADGFASIRGVRLPWPCQANEVFAILPGAADRALRDAGARYYAWSRRSLAPADRPADGTVFARFVCSFQTSAAEVDRCLDLVRAAGRSA